MYHSNVVQHDHSKRDVTRAMGSPDKENNSQGWRECAKGTSRTPSQSSDNSFDKPIDCPTLHEISAYTSSRPVIMNEAEERDLLSETLDYVMARVQTLSEAAIDPNSNITDQISREDCIECCRAIKMLFVDRRAYDPFANAKRKVLSGQLLEMVLKFVFLLRDFNRFPEECQLWLVCVLINLRGRLPVEDVLGGVIVDHANNLCRNLSISTHECFLSMAVQEMWGVYREEENKKFLCLNAGFPITVSDFGTAKQFVIDPFVISIDASRFYESKTSIIQTVLLLLSDKAFIYAGLCESTVNLACEVFLKSVANPDLAYHSILLLHRFLNLKLLHDVHFVCFLDCIVACLQLIDWQDGDQNSIIQAIFAALKQVNIAIKLRNDSEFYQNFTFTSFLPFIRRLLPIVQDGDGPNLSPTVFVSRCLDYFRKDVDWYADDLLQPVTKLMQNLVLRDQREDEIPQLITSLFNFLAKCGGDNCAVGAVDSIVKEVDQSGLDSLYVRQVFISGLAAIPAASEFLGSIVPNEEDMLSIMEELKTTTDEKSDRLNLAMSIISELCHHYKGCPDTLIAFLSLPWICDVDWSTWEHFQKGFPLLVPLKLREDELKAMLSAPMLKQSSIKAIARMPYKNEWRTHIFKHVFALPASPVVVSTLDALPLFCESLPSFSFFDELEPLMIEYSKKCLNTTDDTFLNVGCALFRSVSDCLCIRARDVEFDETVMKCNVCDYKKGNRQTVAINIPPGFLELCKTAVAAEETEANIKFEFIGAACTIFRHVKESLKAKEELVLISLPFFHYLEPVSLVYKTAVGEFVKSGTSTLVARELKIIISQLADREAQIDYYACIAEHSPDRLGKEVLAEAITLACIRPERNVKILNKARNVVNTVAVRDGIRPKTLFIREAAVICKSVANCLMCDVTGAMNAASDDEDKMKIVAFIVEGYMCTLSSVFSLNVSNAPLEVLRAWLEIGVTHLVPYFFLAKNEWVTAAESILKHIINILEVNEKEFVKLSLPNIFFVSAGIRKRNWNDLLVQRIEQFSRVAFNDLIRYEAFKVTANLILCLGFSEIAVISHLEKVFEYIYAGQEIAFSVTECVKPYYLGILLCIRRSFSDDMYFNYREMICRSINKFITYLDDAFLTQSPSKMFAVLRAATPKSDAVMDAWVRLLEKIDKTVLKSMLHQVLFAVSPLITLKGSSRIFKILQELRKGSDPNSNACLRFDRAVKVLHSAEAPLLYLLPPLSAQSQEKPLRSCTKMLVEETSDTYILVLPRMLTLINEDVKYTLMSEVIESLLGALKCNSCPDTMNLIALCLGKCGAIDPGRLGMTTPGDSSRPLNSTNSHLYFIDDRQQFFKDVFKICVRCLLEYADADNVDFIAFAIQEVLKELATHGQMEDIVLNALEPWIRNEVIPFRGTSFKPSLHERLFDDVKPLVPRSQTYDEWLSRWYYTASERIQADNGRVFRTLQYIFFTGSARLAQDLISKVILQAMVEGNTPILDDAALEIKTVFELALVDVNDWIRMATHTCFKLIEFIEKYYYFRIAQDIDPVAQTIGKRIAEFLSSILTTLRPGGTTLLAVDISEKYNSCCRALRWQEQYGLQCCEKGCPQFDHDAYYVLEKLYRDVHDTDNVMGAFSCINKNTSVRSCEQTVAFEAIGNYTAASPLYEQEPLQAVPLVRCYLELNQLVTAFTTAPTLLYNAMDGNERRELLDCLYEAAYRQGNWDYLQQQLQADDDSYVSWGAQVAAVLSSIKSRNEDDYDTRIERARFEAVKALQALTLEDIDTYTQCYTFVQRLHVLSEIDDAVNSLDLLDSTDVPKDELEKLIKRWDMRSENAVQSPGVLAPIYTTRTAILKMTDVTETRNYVCKYILESSKLSRFAGHLSTAWTHIVEARSLNVVDDIAIDIEESRYRYVNNQVSEAITLLQNSLAKNFPDLVKKMESISKIRYTREADIKFYDHLKKMSRTQLSTPVPRQEAFVDAQLQLTEFMEKAKANSYDIYQRYYFLDQFSMNNEHQLYKFALFFDNTFYVNNESDFDVNMFLIGMYRRVLSAGKRYLLHVMPRMLTVWLDFVSDNENLKEDQAVAAKRRRTETSEPNHSRSSKLTESILEAFNSLDRFYFFTAYPQLIARLCINSESVFESLESMLIGLIMEYPHECMWQTVASLRNAQDKVRSQRTEHVLRLLIKKSNEMRSNIDYKRLFHDYTFVARELINVAECNVKSVSAGLHHNFNGMFKILSNHFTDSRVKVSVPFITMVEKRLPTFNASQISMPNNETDDMVYIAGFENDFHVYSSLEKPKRITIIGSNGLRYPLIAKAKDELRKDASCEDLFRTINIFLLRNAESRRRQLHIRTYGVIPLQPRGGIIECVPNLTTFRSAVGIVKSDFQEKYESLWHAEKRPPQKAAIARELIQKSPVRMAKWFRQNYPDPSKWYSARLAFTRTAATMSMVGFILGIGDRHGENVLIDTTTGDCVHVDFNCMFNRGEFLPVPELVPFRLTQNMRDAFGPNGVEGCFRITCETVMRILREETSTIFTVLETFIHDPLLEYNKIERSRQMRDPAKMPKAMAESRQRDIRSELELIRARLDGKVVGVRFNQLTKTSAALNVEGQVAQLIEMTTDLTLLERMYIGWSPHY